MFPSLPELKAPVSSHEGPYLKARRPRLAKAPHRSTVFDLQSQNCKRPHKTWSAGPYERVLPRRAIGTAASEGETVKPNSARGGSEDGSYEEVVLLSKNKFSPTTYFKGIDGDRKITAADAVLNTRKRSLPLHNKRALWNADVLPSDAKELLSPSTQQERLAVQLKLVEEAKEKRIRRDLQTLRESRSISLTGGEATLVVRDHKKMPPDGYIKVSPDKMTKAGRELYLGKNFDKLNPNATLPESQTESTSQAAADADQKASGASETHNGTITVPTAGLGDPDDDNDREESSARVPRKPRNKDSSRKRTTVAVREKRARAREERRKLVHESKPIRETPNDAERQPKSRPVVKSSSDSDADQGTKNKTGSAKSREEMTTVAVQLARQPPRLRRMLKKKLEAAKQLGEESAEPPKPTRVVVKEVSDLIAFVDLETKTHVKKLFSNTDSNPDSNIDFKTLSELLPSSLNEDMLKYLRTLYDYFRLMTTCGIKESSVLAAVAKRLGSKKSLLGRVRLTRPVDEITPGDVKEFMVRFSSCELCGQVTSSKLKELLTSNTPIPQSVTILEDNMETYLCKDNPRLLHKLDFFAYLPYLLSF